GWRRAGRGDVPGGVPAGGAPRRPGGAEGGGVTRPRRRRLQRRLMAPMPVPILVAVLAAAAVLGALVAWAALAPTGADALMMIGGGLAGAAMVALHQWVAIALLPEHTHEPPRDPSRTEVPGDVRERTVATAPSRPLATTRPDRGDR